MSRKSSAKKSSELSELLLKYTNASFTTQLALARIAYWPRSELEFWSSILKWMQECQNPSNEPI